MRFLFSLIFKERLWFVLCAITILIAAALTLAQAGLYTQFASLMVALGAPAGKNTAVVFQPDDSFFHKLAVIVSLYRQGGSRLAIETVLAGGSRFFIFAFGLIALSTLLLLQLFQYLRELSLNYLAVRVAGRIRLVFFEKALHLPSSFYKGSHSGEILSRATNDIHVIQQELGGFLEMVAFAPIMVIAGLTLLFRINAEFTLILLVTAVVAAGLIQTASLFLRKIVHQIQGKLSDLSRHLQEVLYGIDIVKIFGREGFESKKFSLRLADFLKKMLVEQMVVKSIKPFTEFLGALAVLAILLFGAGRIWSGKLSLDTLFHFIIVLLITAPFLQKLASAAVTKQKLGAVVERIEEILNLPEEKRPDPTARFENCKGEITFKKVSFTYPSAAKKTLDSIDLHAKPGEVLALVGASGGGKSTLLYLVPRLFDGYNGQILLDGKNISALDLGALRSQIALVSQESILFPGTIRDNLLYGKPDATEEELISAGKQADIHSFIMSRPDGYNTLVGERGLLLSGGQKQRLAIARALLKKPTILLLDEATSALDSHSERSVQIALEKLMKGRTTLVVAHRLATIMNADQILMMEQGKIVERGKAKELLKKNGAFKKLYDIQFGKKK
jgi:subfamily B ATP-binding cassette protein MsbA